MTTDFILTFADHPQSSCSEIDRSIGVVSELCGLGSNGPSPESTAVARIILWGSNARHGRSDCCGPGVGAIRGGRDDVVAVPAGSRSVGHPLFDWDCPIEHCDWRCHCVSLDCRRESDHRPAFCGARGVGRWTLAIWTLPGALGRGPTTSARHREYTATAAGNGTHESIASTNWAGWIASGTTFTGVGAHWTVPSVVPSPAPEYSSEWVGIDGVLETDLIQTGTSQDTPAGSTSSPDFAWFELLPASPVTINAPVVPGDVMLATITEGSPGSWTISIEDQTQSWIYTNTFSYSISAQTAEWIEEAPTVGGVTVDVGRLRVEHLLLPWCQR